MLQKIPLPKNPSQWRLLFIAYIILIAIVSLTPSESRDLPIKHIDKIGHFLAYVVMMVLALVSFKGQNGRISAVILTLLIAFLLEWGQGFVPGRISSLTDGITNYLGLLSGFILYWFYLRRFEDY